MGKWEQTEKLLRHIIPVRPTVPNDSFRAFVFFPSVHPFDTLMPVDIQYTLTNTL